MKTMSVKDLGCPMSDDTKVRGETFEEIAEACQKHAMAKIAAGNEEYVVMANEMKSKSPEEQQQAFSSFRQKFEETPEDAE